MWQNKIIISLVLLMSTVICNAGDGSHAGDRVCSIIRNAKETAAEIVAKLKPDSFEPDTSDEMKSRILGYRDALRLDILASPHNCSRDNIQSSCAQAFVGKRGDSIRFSIPLCT